MDMQSTTFEHPIDSFLAHGPNDDNEPEALRLHLDRVARLAAEFAGAFGAADWGRLAGQWHDLGKYSRQFQEYLRTSIRGDTGEGGRAMRVDHSTAGAQHAVQALDEKVVGMLLAYCIAGHHAGLPDTHTDSESCLDARLEKHIPAIPAAPADVLAARALALPPLRWTGTNSERAFQAAVFCRMLFSALVDADFLATEQHFSTTRAAQRPPAPPAMETMERAVLEYIASLGRTDDPSPINEIRSRILEQCLTASACEPGFFSLTVPTGGGKTLASLAMSLRHARHHDLRRIIYAVPFTSIIEQNAKVFRDALAAAGEELVLEHHSNVEPDGESVWSRMAAENWDAPVVVTTNVQFFESLFANRTSRCRKLHRIVGSIIVLDECQSIPVPLLAPCLAILRELVRNYRCTVILCTATRPALDHREGFEIGLEEVREVISDPARLARQMKRIDIEHVGPMSDVELVEAIAGQRQAMCIVNTRAHAATLAQLVADEVPVIHLSANMCPQHRSEVIKQIRQKLGRHEPCRVVSTQLVEAGVDLDFPVVYRAMAGLDSIVQAAGRCNREGRSDRGRVIVFDPEVKIPRGELRRAAQSCELILPRFEEELLSLDAIEAYFREHYWTQRDQWDRHDVLDCFRNGGAQLNFRQAAERFRFIRDEQAPLIIPWGEKGKALVQRLRQSKRPDRATLRLLQRYSVQIPQSALDALRASGAELLHDLWTVLTNNDLYTNTLGLCLPAGSLPHNPEDLIA